MYLRIDNIHYGLAIIPDMDTFEQWTIQILPCLIQTNGQTYATTTARWRTDDAQWQIMDT